jgi:hypothetical protein
MWELCETISNLVKLHVLQDCIYRRVSIISRVIICTVPLFNGHNVGFRVPAACTLISFSNSAAIGVLAPFYLDTSTSSSSYT